VTLSTHAHTQTREEKREENREKRGLGNSNTVGRKPMVLGPEKSKKKKKRKKRKKKEN